VLQKGVVNWWKTDGVYLDQNNKDKRRIINRIGQPCFENDQTSKPHAFLPSIPLQTYNGNPASKRAKNCDGVLPKHHHKEKLQTSPFKISYCCIYVFTVYAKHFHDMKWILLKVIIASFSKCNKMLKCIHLHTLINKMFTIACKWYHLQKTSVSRAGENSLMKRRKLY
jgi:hypothetical protein